MSVPAKPASSPSLPSTKRVFGALGSFAGLAVVAGLLVGVLVIPLLVVSSNTVSSGVDAFDDLPGYLAINPPAQATSIYAKNGTQDVKIATFYVENRTDVASNQIASSVKEAAVAAEDPRFFSEGAIDLTGTLRGVLATTFGHTVEGGSSITQQYVKNVLVQRCETENTDAATAASCYKKVTAVTPQRKLQEIRYAISIEKTYSKDQILRGYLNIVGFGGDVYGVQAAAQYYFGVNASQLTLAQSATLVAILNNPANLRIDQPTDTANGSANHYALTTTRRNYVLQRMSVHGMITKAQLTAAEATPITPTITQTPYGCSAATAYDAAYFCEYVQNVILNDTAFGATADDRYQTLNEGGLSIHTTLNLALQKTAQDSLSAYLPTSVAGMDIGASNVSVEPGTGRIVTMVQNTDFVQGDQTAPGETSINYNTDKAYGGSDGFETGSAFKAFTLAAWLEAGHSLSEYVSTTTHDFPTADFTNSCANINGQDWQVANADPAAPELSVLQATAQSVNTAFARMGTQLDLCSILDDAKGMGIHAASSDNPLTSVPSMILGTNYIAPLSMATAYAGIADGGTVCTPIAIDSITSATGASITPTRTSCTQGMPSNIAAGVAYALQTVLQPGGTGVTANPGDGIPILAKTGTTDSAEQNWLITSTTKVANATWVGNVTGSTDFYNASVNGVNGYTLKFDIAKPILQALDAQYGGTAFATPPLSEISG